MPGTGREARKESNPATTTWPQFIHTTDLHLPSLRQERRPSRLQTATRHVAVS